MTYIPHQTRPQIARIDHDLHTAAAESRPQMAQMNDDFDGARDGGELTGRVIGVFYDVYNELGFGDLESVYRRAMMVGLAHAGISGACEVPIEVLFRGAVVGRFRADLIVENSLVIEVKSAQCSNQSTKRSCSITCAALGSSSGYS